MPVTARLSRKFSERFGDDLVNECRSNVFTAVKINAWHDTLERHELVEWFNDRRESFRAWWTPRTAVI